MKRMSDRLTTDTVAQAIERADPAKFNRGGEAAKSAIEMATVMRMIRGEGENPVVETLHNGEVGRKKARRKK